MSPILAAIQVSLLAMCVIFIVLGILIGVIKVLVHFLPYVEEPAPPARSQAPSATGAAQEEDHIAAIHAALAHHLSKAPQDIHIQHITSI